MILKTLSVDVGELAERTGWTIKPEGACRGELCVPLPAREDISQVDARVLAERLGMPLLHDEARGIWCLGPAASVGGGRVLDSAQLPEIVLPDLDGRPFALSSLRGQKVLLVAWASW